MHAREVHAHEMHAREVHAHEVHAYEVHGNEMHAREVHAHEMHAREVHAHEVQARRRSNQSKSPASESFVIELHSNNLTNNIVLHGGFGVLTNRHTQST